MQSNTKLIIIIKKLAHGFQGVIKKQINLEKNNPQKCYQKYLNWSSLNKECDIPIFEGSSASSFYWIMFSIVIYVLERIARLLRSFRPYTIEEYKIHPSKVLQLMINNIGVNKISYHAGQYVYLNLKSIAYFEWHPFTITSSPDDDFLTVHIRCEGDWTSKYTWIKCYISWKTIPVFLIFLCIINTNYYKV